MCLRSAVEDCRGLRKFVDAAEESIGGIRLAWSHISRQQQQQQWRGGCVLMTSAG